MSLIAASSYKIIDSAYNKFYAEDKVMEVKNMNKVAPCGIKFYILDLLEVEVNRFALEFDYFHNAYAFRFTLEDGFYMLLATFSKGEIFGASLFRWDDKETYEKDEEDTNYNEAWQGQDLYFEKFND